VAEAAPFAEFSRTEKWKSRTGCSCNL